jgi:hypothetical protein
MAVAMWMPVGMSVFAGVSMRVHSPVFYVDSLSGAATPILLLLDG